MSLLMENSVAKIGCGDPGDPIDFGALFTGSQALEQTFAHDRSDKWALSFWMKKIDDADAIAFACAPAGSATQPNNGSFLFFNNTSDGLIALRNAAITPQTNYSALNRLTRDFAGWMHGFYRWNSALPLADARYLAINLVPQSMTNAAGLDNFFKAVRHAIGGHIPAHGGAAIPSAKIKFADFIGVTDEDVTEHDFCRINSDGVPVPKTYQGGYGVNGFHLDFADPANMGKDVSSENLVAGSEDFSSGWNANGIIVSGTNRLVPSTANDFHYITDGVPVVAGQSYVAKSWVSPEEFDEFNISFGSGQFGTDAYAVFELSGDGSVISAGSATSNVSCVLQADGRYLCKAEAIAIATTSYGTIGLMPNPAGNTGRYPQYAGTGTDGLTLHKVHVRNSTSPDRYEKTTDAIKRLNHFETVGTIRQVTDTPTNNFAVGNPLDAPAPAGRVLSEGNAVWQPAHNPGEGHIASTMLIPDGKFYWEVTPLVGAPFAVETIVPGIGFAHKSVAVNEADGSAIGLFHYQSNGNVIANPWGIDSGFPTWTVNDVISVAIDGTTGDCWFAKNGVWISGNPETGTDPVFTIPSGYLDGLRASVQDSAASGAISARVNFGQNAFVHQIPGGFATLSTGSMPCPVILDPSRYVQAPMTIGGGAVTSLWNCLTNKTLVISKRRDAAGSFRLNVVIDGVQYTVAVDAYGTQIFDADGLTFTTDGFTLGSDTEYQGTCEHFVRRASPLAGMDFVLIDNHVSGQVSTIAHNCGGPIHRAWDIPLDGGAIRQFHHKMPAGDYTLVDQAGRGNDLDWFGSTANTVSIGGASVAGRHLLILERGVAQFSSFDVYTGSGSVDGPFIPADFASLWLDVVRGDVAGPHTVRTLRADDMNPVINELRYDWNTGSSTLPDKFYLLSNGAKCATDGGTSGGEHTNANGGKYYTAMYALTPGKFASAR